MNVKTSILITGAAKRIGKAIACALGSEGRRVAVHYCDSRSEAEKTVREIEEAGGEAAAFSADLRKESQIHRLVADVEKKFGVIDVLINNAAVYGTPELAGKTEGSIFDDYIAVNLRAPYLLSALIGAKMKRGRGGKIVNIVDWTGHRPDPRMIPYSISKGGLVTMTHALALALAPKVLVNGVAPGAILPPSRRGKGNIAGAIARTPLRRQGSPADIVEAVRFLVDKGDYMTGNVLFVDGGRFLVG